MRTKLSDLHTLPDVALAKLWQAVRQEKQRRSGESLATPGGSGRYNLLPAQASVWPGAMAAAVLAEELAVVVGAPGSGKTLLRSILWDLGGVHSVEALPCPCGYFYEKRGKCGCTRKDMQQHYAKNIPSFGVGIVIPPTSALATPGELQVVLSVRKSEVGLARALMAKNGLDEAMLQAMRQAESHLGSAELVYCLARAMQALDRAEGVLDPAYLYRAGRYRPLKVPK